MGNNRCLSRYLISNNTEHLSLDRYLDIYLMSRAGPGAWWRGWCGLAPVHTCQVASPVSRRQQPRHHVDTQWIHSRYLPTPTTTSTKHWTKRSVPPSPFCDCLQLCECKQGKVAALGWAGLGCRVCVISPSSFLFAVLSPRRRVARPCGQCGPGLGAGRIRASVVSSEVRGEKAE